MVRHAVGPRFATTARSLSWALVLLILPVSLVSASLGRKPTAHRPVDVLGGSGGGGTPEQAIPRDPYKSWTLFLVCNPDWLTPEKNRNLQDLYQRFHGLGRAIGDENATVWFSKPGTAVTAEHFADKVDVERSARFCKALHLLPSEGPFIAFFLTYPEPTEHIHDDGDIALGSMNAAQMAGLIGKMSNELLLQGRVTLAQRAPAKPELSAPGPRAPAAGPPMAPARPQPPPAGSLMARIVASALSVIQSDLRAFGCWTLKVKTPGIEGSFSPCKQGGACQATPTFTR